jgi:hypothetical protein
MSMTPHCEWSGLPLDICRGSFCDCFDHEDVEPASESRCDAYFAEPYDAIPKERKPWPPPEV